MKLLYLCLLPGILVSTFVGAQSNVVSQIYHWDHLQQNEKNGRISRPLLEGQTTHLENLEIHATTIPAQAAPHPAHHHLEEELLIVKEGSVEVTIDGQTSVLGPKGIALIHSQAEHGFRNAGDTPATYYVMRYRSFSGLDEKRGLEENGSFTVDYPALEYREHDKGGRRNYFDRPTTMCEDFEMHMTNLNPGTASHAPHTHEVEEIILITQGEVEMHIDGKNFKAKSGDLVFLDSMIPHAATNIGEGQCQYFAFQWK